MNEQLKRRDLRTQQNKLDRKLERIEKRIADLQKERESAMSEIGGLDEQIRETYYNAADVLEEE